MKEYYKARYEISGTFRITGRGLVFAGTVQEGAIQIGDFIRFKFNRNVLERRIIGVDASRQFFEHKPKVGILIECEDEGEIEELRNWEPDMVQGIIFSGKHQ